MHSIAATAWNEASEAGEWWPLVLSHHQAGKMNTVTSSSFKHKRFNVVFYKYLLSKYGENLKHTDILMLAELNVYYQRQVTSIWSL